MKDDSPILISRKDFSGGINNRQQGSVIKENQATVLKNIDITVPGETRKCPGLTLIEDLGSNVGTGLFGFEPTGGINELMAVHAGTLTGWIGSGSFTNRKTDFVSGTPVTMLKAGESGENDVLLVYLEGNNWFRMNQSYSFQDLGNTNTSPPLSEVSTFFRQRQWILKDNLLYYSSPYPADFSTAFDRTTNNYRIDCGEERALIPIRDMGLICIGSDAIWGLNPSVTPAATDKPEKILDFGCVAGKTAVQVGDDIIFLSSDGIRGLFRTQLDKVQSGASYPLSFPIKEEIERLSWSYIGKACAIYFDNKYFISVPVNASTYNNEVWVYYPAYQAWIIITGWNVAAWTKMKVNGEERLYAIDSLDTKVYRAWYGYSNNGEAINYQEEGRKEDFGHPLIKKAGGEIKIKALSSGNYNLSVYASIDDQGYILLGTINLSGNAPTLEVALPFDLADDNIVEESFHIDSLGPFYHIRIKIQHNALNGSDNIKVYERAIVTYAEEYQSE